MSKYWQYILSGLVICFLAFLGIISIIFSDNEPDINPEVESVLYEMEDQTDKNMLDITQVELPTCGELNSIKDKKAYDLYQNNEINDDIYTNINAEGPYTSKTELIERGGFIDTISDAVDLGLERLLEVNNHREIKRGDYLDSSINGYDTAIQKLFDKNSSSEKPCSDTPSSTTTLNELSLNKRSVNINSDSHDEFSPFTPITLQHLKNEIKKNE